MKHKTIGVLGSAAVFSLLSASAHAQNTAGALQLALGTDVVTYTSATSTASLPAGDVDTDSSNTRWGFGNRSGVNIEGGYGLGDSLVLGGFLALGGFSQTATVIRNNNVEGKASEFNLLLAPKLDYMLFPGGRVRPFFGGALGILYQSMTEHTRTGNLTQTTRDDSLTGLALMLRAGLRCFLTPGFSVDPALAFTWIPTASGSTLGPNAAKYDLGAHGYSIGLTVAASGWVGL